MSRDQTGSTLDRLAVVTGRMAESKSRHAGRQELVKRQADRRSLQDRQAVLTIIVNTDMHCTLFTLNGLYNPCSVDLSLNNSSLTGDYWIHRKIRLIECNAKCRYLKKLASKGTLRLVFICLWPRTPPPPPLHTV
jgi:hypothetical protein